MSVHHTFLSRTLIIQTVTWISWRGSNFLCPLMLSQWGGQTYGQNWFYFSGQRRGHGSLPPPYKYATAFNSPSLPSFTTYIGRPNKTESHVGTKASLFQPLAVTDEDEHMHRHTMDNISVSEWTNIKSRNSCQLHDALKISLISSYFSLHLILYCLSHACCCFNEVKIILNWIWKKGKINFCSL